MPFVYGSWLESYGKGSPATTHVPKSSYYPEQRHVIDGIIARPETQVIVASIADDPAVLLAFSCTRHFAQDALAIVDYVYVKGAFRRMGIGRGLLESAGIGDLNRCICTHHSYESLRLKVKWPSLLYNPYRAKES